MLDTVRIAWWGMHNGEEPLLVPAGGIFFSGCHLHCVYCQNYQISQKNVGKDYGVKELVEIMLDLEKQGAVNIDLVTPTIWWKQIKEAIILAKQQGLKIPIVWNSNGYEAIEILKQMEGLVDIYLPDFKYSDDDLAEKYSGIKNYFAITKTAIVEMYRQVGLLKIKNNIATRGLIVRHLVLPSAIENSKKVLETIAKLDNNIHIALMNQYYPMYNAKNFSEINRPVSETEFNNVYDKLLDLGFTNGWVQGEKSQTNLIPDFTKSNPFS
ncbi:MAG: Radical SAM domain protein [Candidatus Magasanikbacteria bacterium GW2011_GWA2_37_8]|uniref:Radical SAM domain protein n=1 Tax=Candidatus Magasanikbacteria bacterium GW2011_GWA2_37_8 TaxID=1619036 RepID=A0A0G0HN91_9BACT|nr:MAG: Radical SAM domain protein [Candidatus Magasanikbacteria bacterium GW2011_GWA2_37_8]